MPTVHADLVAFTEDINAHGELMRLEYRKTLAWEKVALRLREVGQKVQGIVHGAGRLSIDDVLTLANYFRAEAPFLEFYAEVLKDEAAWRAQQQLEKKG